MQICATVDHVCEFELFFKGQRWINVLSVYPDSNISQSGEVQVNHVEFLRLAQSCNIANFKTFCAIIEIKFYCCKGSNDYQSHNLVGHDIPYTRVNKRMRLFAKLQGNMR